MSKMIVLLLVCIVLCSCEYDTESSTLEGDSSDALTPQEQYMYSWEPLEISLPYDVLVQHHQETSVSVHCEDQRDLICDGLYRMAEAGLTERRRVIYLCEGPGRYYFTCQ